MNKYLIQKQQMLMKNQNEYKNKNISINKNGFWESLNVETAHYYDLNLSNYLVKFFKEEKANIIADFGCGMGKYIENLKNNNINAIGFDGNPNTPELTNNLCEILDLSISKQFEKKFDWIISFEVGEHLPKEFEDIFINNLHNNNKYGIILSWAIEGQGGDGHFNERNNDYIKSKIINLGYINDIDEENKMRDISTLSWFKNTIMVFRKKNII
jgi:cyclopropane fatty-acyl-phospholipid synthase-like methyltransferase